MSGRVGAQGVGGWFSPVLPDGTVVARRVPRSWAVFAALALGLVCGRWAGGESMLWFSAGAGFCAAGVLGRGVMCRGALWLAVVCLSAGWFVARLVEGPADSLARMVPRDGPAIVRFHGVVLETPRRVEWEPDPLSLPIRDSGWKMRVAVRAVEAEGTRRVSGRVWVRAPERDEMPARAGDRVWIEGVFAPVAGPMNPGEPDRRLWAGQEGYVGSVRAGEVVVEEEAGTWAAVEGTWLGARAWMADRARALLLGEEAGPRRPDADAGGATGRALLAALILGEEEPALREARGAFNRLGLAHVLSISGFHLAVLAAVALFALRAAGDLGWREPVLVSLLIAAYLAILPVNAPVWRSGLMVIGLLAADAAGRRYDRLAILGWIAVGLLIWRPMDLWSIGFQLSFGLVAVLLWMGEAVNLRVWGMKLQGTVPTRPRWWRWPLGQIKMLTSTNLLCCAAATPAVMYHTGLVSVLAVASGVVVVPLITVVLVCGYGAVGIGVLAPAATGVTAGVLAWMAGAVAWVVEGIDQAPGSSLRVPNVSAAWAIAATAVLLYWFARGYLRSRGLWAATAAVALWGGAELWLGSGLSSGAAVRVDTLAVGDGTCHLVRSGRGAMLWDCGSLTPGVGRRLVPRAVRALGASTVPTVVITHPNLDHFNGVLDVVEPLRVERVLIGEAFVAHAAARPGSGEAYVLSELKGRGVEVRVVGAGERLELGEVSVEFISPPRGADWGEDNDRSLVAVIGEAGREGVLLCGDIQGEAMGWIRSQRPGLRAAVMEAPHHGSAREPAYEFVADVGARVVVQSTGPGRAGDARWDGVRAGRAWWCTATDGAAWAELRKDGSVRSGALGAGRR